MSILVEFTGSQANKCYTAKNRSLLWRRIFKIISAVSLSGLLWSSANANMNYHLVSTTEYLDYELPKSIQEHCLERGKCPEIEIKKLNTNHDWINQMVNKRAGELAINITASDVASKSTNAKVNLKEALDNFAAESLELPKDVPWAYQLMITPEYLGHVSSFELFEIDSYVFTGGAHGMPYSEYLIFDHTTKAQIGLDGMLQPGQASSFETLAYKAYKEWVKTVDNDVESYEKQWPFVMSKNITLTDKGVDIRYQHYEIGPYAYGMPVLSIPYDKLKSIIKPHFIPKQLTSKVGS